MKELQNVCPSSSTVRTETRCPKCGLSHGIVFAHAIVIGPHDPLLALAWGLLAGLFGIGLALPPIAIVLATIAAALPGVVQCIRKGICCHCLIEFPAEKHRDQKKDR